MTNTFFNIPVAAKEFALNKLLQVVIYTSSFDKVLLFRFTLKFGNFNKKYY